MKNIIKLLFVTCLPLLFACNNQTKNHDTKLNNNKEISVGGNNKATSISLPEDNAYFTVGDKILFKVETIVNISIDSILIKTGKTHIATIYSSPYEYNWEAKGIRTGKNVFKITVYYEGKKDNHIINLNFKSDIIPKKYTVKIIKKYPHDKNAYTQGLIYEDGYIYEGTGQFGNSSLQKYRLENHEIVQSYSNASNIFGEGIIISGNKLIQLTWQSGVGFIYDKETFKKTGKFNIQTEGWGLTTDGNKLLMSDGSNKIYFLETEVFTKIDEIEVYNNYGKVNKLNELEYINGYIYANLYRDDIDRIVIIEPETGKVTGIIDASSIRPKEVPRHPDYVLNGIAWNSKTKRLLLTGKYWPYIYEVELVEKEK